MIVSISRRRKGTATDVTVTKKKREKREKGGGRTPAILFKILFQEIAERGKNVARGKGFAY